MVWRIAVYFTLDKGRVVCFPHFVLSAFAWCRVLSLFSTGYIRSRIGVEFYFYSGVSGVCVGGCFVWCRYFVQGGLGVRVVILVLVMVVL